MRAAFPSKSPTVVSIWASAIRGEGTVRMIHCRRMSGRILVAVESKPVVSALRRDLEPAGFGMDAVHPADAAGKLDPQHHVAAIVRAGPGADLVVAALRRADPHLTVLALFFDEEE